jgi:hypothetical protein
VGRIMQPRPFRFLFLMSWVICGIAGCTGPAGRLPEDPLLLSKTPVKGRIDRPGAILLARTEPRAPIFPETTAAYFANKTRPAPLSPVAVSAIAVARRKESATFQHAPDYSWLQGTILKTPRGMELSYRASPDDDPWGGRVPLENDERLEQLRAGDIVRVEGECVALPGSLTGPDVGKGVRTYRIRHVWLIRREDKTAN